VFVTSIAPTWNYVLAENLLLALMARPGAALMATPTVHLFTAVSAPISPTITTSAFTEASFTGYAAVVLSSLDGPVNLPPANVIGSYQTSNFIAGSVTSPGQTILGYWVDNGAATMYLAELFAAPIPIARLGDFISLDVIWGNSLNTQLQ
jgi:hypothetical protein